MEEVEEAVGDFDADAEACWNPQQRFWRHKTWKMVLIAVASIVTGGGRGEERHGGQ